MKSEALYVPDGDFLMPTDYTVGPWSPDAQHGGPVSALMARALEQHPSDQAMQLVRITVELVRPVPLRPLRITSVLSRPGRNVQLVDASLFDGETEVTRARGLRIRKAEVDLPASMEDTEIPPVPPQRFAGADAATKFIGAVDLRFVKGTWEQQGPVQLWGRLLVPVVEGERASAFQQAAAIADFGNGVSRLVDFDTHMFINPDLTVALGREPQGEWIGMDTVSRLSPSGFGQAESCLFDEQGVVGHSIQSLLVANR